jgi:hypothetical protein
VGGGIGARVRVDRTASAGRSADRRGGSHTAGSMLPRAGSIPSNGIAGGNTPGARQCHRDDGAAPPAMGVPHLRQLA